MESGLDCTADKVSGLPCKWRALGWQSATLLTGGFVGESLDRFIVGSVPMMKESGRSRLHTRS